jgi:hypothetical protein
MASRRSVLVRPPTEPVPRACASMAVVILPKRYSSCHASQSTSSRLKPRSLQREPSSPRHRGAAMTSGNEEKTLKSPHHRSSDPSFRNSGRFSPRSEQLPSLWNPRRSVCQWSSASAKSTEPCQGPGSSRAMSGVRNRGKRRSFLIHMVQSSRPLLELKRNLSTTAPPVESSAELDPGCCVAFFKCPLASTVHPVNRENVLGEIDADCRNAYGTSRPARNVDVPFPC